MSTAVVGPDPGMATVRWPRLQACKHCHQEVLVGTHERYRRIVVMEPMPVLVGVRRCPHCRGKGIRQVPMYVRIGARELMTTVEPGDLEGRMSKGTMTSCPECAGTGLRGEELTRRGHVVMRLDGVVRAEPVMLSPWDSAYRRHRCPTR